tara:strand:- start:9126 stop:10202 length:1077 start_codon:yes stop_codon:yes gene_type:complete
MTYGMSLEKWKDVGNLKRETEYINYLVKYLRIKELLLFSYGNYEIENEIARDHIKCRVVIINFRNLANNYKLLRKVDIVRTNQMYGSEFAWLFRVFLCKKAILLVRTGFSLSSFMAHQNKNYLKRKYSKLLETFYSVSKHVDKIFVPSNLDYATYKNSYKVEILPNSLPHSKYYESMEMVLARRKNVILCVGRIHAQKRFDRAIEVARKTNLPILIIGHGEEADKEKLLSESDGVNITFKDNISHDEMLALMASVKFFLLSSDYEGMPKVLMEAHACGAISVATNVESVTNILSGNYSRKLISNNNSADELSDIINQVKDWSQHDFDEYLKECRDFSLNFSMQCIAMKETQIINNVGR